MRDRLTTVNVRDSFPSQTIGTAFYIDFSSFNENPGQFEIISDEDDPLGGDNSDNITFK